MAEEIDAMLETLKTTKKAPQVEEELGVPVEVSSENSHVSMLTVRGEVESIAYPREVVKNNTVDELVETGRRLL